jgi:hypothetical protein
LSSAGQLVLYLFTYQPKEFRTFLLKIDRKLLKSVSPSASFDSCSLDYVDISKLIKKGIDFLEPLPLIAYLFDSIDYLSEALLAYLNLDKDVIRNVKMLSDKFREFREQKNLIKSIKYKVEIIKANKNEGKTLDGICRTLALGESEK